MLRTLRSPASPTPTSWRGSRCSWRWAAPPTRSTRSGARTSSTARSSRPTSATTRSARGDVKDNSLNTFDVPWFLGADVVDGSLTAKDFTKDQYNASLFVGDVGANPSGKDVDFGLVSSQNETLLVTPEWESTSSWLSYVPEYHSTNGVLSIKVSIRPPPLSATATPRFRILVIDSEV